MRITRYQMYKRIFETLPLPLKGKILGISGLKYWLGSRNYKPPQEVISKEAEVTQADYPKVNILEMPYENETFDWVICDQVLEHVEGDPQKAINEIRRVLKPKGIAIIASPFLYPLHWGPKDFWRFSKDGFKYLCRDFSEIKIESWGNRWINTLFFIYKKSMNWEVPERKFSFKHFLATYNQEKYPVVVWVIAKK